MALDLLAIISAAGTGAITGYLTNNLALKMIFKEYGPLGGVVVKTKTEFIESISKLVEKDLINHQTLVHQFSNPNFQANFEQTVVDFLDIYLVQHSQKLKLAEISGFEKNFELLSSKAGQATAESIINISQKLEEKELKEIIPEEKQEQLLRELSSSFINKARSEASLEKILLNFFEQLQNKSLNDLINKQSYLQLQEIIKGLISYLQANQAELEDLEKEELKNKIKELFNLDQTGAKIISQIKELKLSDLIKSEKSLRKIAAESNFTELLKEILVNFKIELENSELSLEDFMTAELKKTFQKDIAVFINQGQTELLDFLAAEKSELDQIIFGAIEAEIEASSGFKAMSRQGIYNKYQENIEEYGLPTKHLKDYLETKVNSEQQKLAAEIFEKIKTVKINKLLVNFDLDKIALKLENLFFDFYSKNKEQKLIELFAEEIFDQENLKDSLIELSFDFLAKITNDQKAVAILFDYLMNLKLQNFVDQEKIELKKASLAEPFYQFLLSENSIIPEIQTYLNQNFFTILGQELQSSEPQLEKELNKYFKSLKTSFASKKIQSLTDVLPKKPEAVAELTESVTTFFYNNLPELLEGQVAKAAAANLKQLSDQEVQKAIEDFMGKELKPITYLGALLGAVAGVLFSVSGAETAIFNSSPVWVNYLSSAVLYGGVGWLTNVLAIWMIFHPYQEYNILGAQLPFTPGVVAKNRNRFADSMGEFVEKELLQAKTAAEIIENNRSAIKNRILEYFAENNYQQIFSLLEAKNDVLAENLIEKIKQLLNNLTEAETANLSQNIEKKAGQLLVKNLKTFNFKEKINNYLAESEKSLTKLNSFFLANFSLDKIIAVLTGNYSFDLNSKQLKKIFKNKELYPLFKFILPSLLAKESGFNLKNKILKVLRTDSSLYLDQSLELFFEQETKVAQAINFKKDEIIEKEKEKKGGLLKNTMISGAIYMADLDQFVDSVVARVFTKLKQEYFVEKRAKLEASYSKILAKIEAKKLAIESDLSLNQILKEFLKSKKGSKILTEVLYLSDDSLAELIELILKEDEKELLALNFEIKAEAVEYLINQQLSLEQKLQLLISIKKLFRAENIKEQIKKLLKKIDLNILTKELELLLTNFKLTKAQTSELKLREEIKNNCTNLLEEEDFKQLLLKNNAAQISKLVKKMEKEMDRESLEDLLILFIEAGIDSFKNNSEALLQSLKLKDLTAAEVRKMDPAEIEALFDSFAGKYFAQLKEYGWFGGIFGVIQLLIRTII